MTGSVTDGWVMRRLPAVVRACGLDVQRCVTHGYVGTDAAEYLLTIVDRGADMQEATGRIGRDLSAALRDEARRRVAAGTFFAGSTTPASSPPDP